MLIDNCGVHAGDFHKMFDDILKQRMKDGKEVTPQDKENLDYLLFNAYKEILIDSPNEEIAEDSLNNLQKMLSSGTVEILDIPKISKSINEQVVDDYNGKQKADIHIHNIGSITNDTNDVDYKKIENQNISSIKTAAAIGTTVALYEVDKTLINSMCTKSMEASHKNTYESARNGNEDSINTLDLVRKASNYIVAKDRLNPKGREKGALALIEQLLHSDNPEAKEMAMKVASKLELKDITKNGELDIVKVKERLQKEVPKLNIDDLNERGKRSALDRKEKIMGMSSESYKEDVERLAERKRITMFTQNYMKAIRLNQMEEAGRLIRADTNLAEKSLVFQKRIYENFIQKKGKENDTLRKSIVLLSSKIKRDKETEEQQPSKIENNDEER